MKVLSLKLKESIFEEVEKVIHQIHSSRNAYINEALRFYNKLYRRKLLRKRFAKEAKLVRDSSLEVLQDFEKFEDEIS